jgi:hypothetical protein
MLRTVSPLILALALSGPLQARLPAPTPEEQAAAEKKKAAQAQDTKREQEALTRVQDALAARFGKSAAAQGAGPTEQANLPAKAVEQDGQAGPTGGTRQSAEAHSSQAR